MTVVARRFASVPARSAVDTWQAIVALIAPDAASPARDELAAVGGVVCSLIASEMKGAIVVHGSGPRLRIYCLFGDDAIEGDEVSEGGLTFVPTSGDWRVSLPCPADELEWVRNRLRGSAHVSARDEDKEVNVEADTQSHASDRRAPKVDMDAFLRG